MMNERLQNHMKTATRAPSFMPARTGLLQRKCDCGSSARISGECEKCQEKQLTINRYSTDRLARPSTVLARSTPLPESGAGGLAVAGRHIGRLSASAAALSGTNGERAVSQPGDRSELEADRAAEQEMRALLSPLFEEKQEAPEAMVAGVALLPAERGMGSL